MTKEAYYEMCEAINSEPDPTEVPPEFEDLIVEAQEAYEIFCYLPDRWSEMSGGYVGKDLSNISVFFDLFNIPRSNWLLYMDLIYVAIENKKAAINNKIAADAKKSENSIKSAAKLKR